MIILLSFLYIVVGAAVCGVVYYMWFWREYDGGWHSLLVGFFWPVAAPFTFAILLAKQARRRKL